MKAQRPLNAGADLFNQMDFHIRRLLAGINTAEPVKVIRVHSPAGRFPVGFVDARPLISLVDGEGKGQEQAVLYRLPYLRIQGGRNAILVDPAPGDTGLAVYAQRDTETLKETRQGPVNPGSGRSLDQGDGFYLGGFLNAAPERWVEITDAGIDVEAADSLHTHGKITIMDAEDGWTVNAAAGAMLNAASGAVINAAAGVVINGDLLINGSVAWTGSAGGPNGSPAKFASGVKVQGGLSSNGISLDTHTHYAPDGGGQTGEPLGGPQ